MYGDGIVVPAATAFIEAAMEALTVSNFELTEV
jgi:hypothetical protein